MGEAFGGGGCCLRQTSGLLAWTASNQAGVKDKKCRGTC